VALNVALSPYMNRPLKFYRIIKNIYMVLTQ
jgi:hypothetical protein